MEVVDQKNYTAVLSKISDRGKTIFALFHVFDPQIMRRGKVGEGLF